MAKGRMILFAVFSIALLGLPWGCNGESQKSSSNRADIAAKNDIDSQANTSILKDGKYTATSGQPGAEYNIFFELSGDRYKKVLLFEDEVVWKCSGCFAIQDSFFIRAERICEFLREEESRLPEKYGDLKVPIRNITADSFDLFLSDDNSEALGVTGWVTLKRIKTISQN
jgi:hypothetical protein